MMDAVDLWLYDLKHLDPEAHRALTGSHNETILDNLERLLSAGAEVVLRLPLIPGCNDDDGSMARLAAWLAEHAGVSEVHLMPYNMLAESKYESIGLPYPLRGARAIPPARIEAHRNALSRAHVVVRVGG